jgi:hypothetical protein
MSNKFRVALQDKLASYGFETYDEDVIVNVVGNSSKWMKKQLSRKALTGGRIAMPGEYFALPSQNLTGTAGDNLTHVTDNFVRPGIAETFFGTNGNVVAPSCGGAPMTLSPLAKGVASSCGGGGLPDDVMFDNALKTFRASSGGKGVRISAQQKVGLKMLYNQMMNSALAHVRKTSPKTKHLKAKALNTAFDKKM